VKVDKEVVINRTIVLPDKGQMGMKVGQPKPRQKTGRSVLSWIVQAAGFVILVASAVWILQSESHVTMQFMSFAVMFIVTGLLIWPLAKPLSD
jgi:hypothetical protein